MRNILSVFSRHAQSSTFFLQIAAFAAVYLIWGSTYLAIFYAIKSFPPFLMLGVRFGVAGILLFTIMKWRGCPSPSFSQVKTTTLLGVMMLFVGTGGIAWAEHFIPTGLAALLVSTVPLWIVLLEWLWEKGDRPRGPVIIALAIGLLGVTLVSGSSATYDGNLLYFVAIGVSLVAALSWSVGSLLGRRLELPNNPFMTAALQMISGGIALTLFGLLLGEHHELSLSRVSLKSVLAVAYLLVFGSLVAFTAFVWLLKHVRPSRVATYAFVNPIVAVLLGTFVAAEPLTLRIAFSGLLLIIAVVIIVSPAGTTAKRSQRIRRNLARRSDRLQRQIENRRADVRMQL